VTRLFVLARHGESTLNVARVVNGDPAVDVRLTERGRQEASLLGQQLRNVPLDLCIVTRFGRTRETAEIALETRGVRFEVEPLLDDVDVGDLEGAPIDDYRAWKRSHARGDPFPNGESLDAAASGASDPGRDARDSRAVCTQCGGVPRPRPTPPRDRQRDAVPVRGGAVGGGGSPAD
jgi:broad specificity phosphatase PhoE